ncbi:MAG: hypothetical protein PHQ40_17950 [Anaerolineaceae bacterium]|nr:hypothetical protein [Anaerolineaceae bacterium]
MKGPITNELIQAILEQYPLQPWGVHGLSHWARVLENGRRLASLTRVDVAVVELFSVFHDACRENEGVDFVHGRHGALLAKRWRGKYFDLSDAAMEQLVQACAGHTNGHTRADVSVQTCWDSDRLDLGRVGIIPSSRRLCTPAARVPEMIAWAHQRARMLYIPALIKGEWGIDL